MKPTIHPHPYHTSSLKRIFDIGVSCLGLVIFSPLLIFISIIVLLSSKGPVFFTQKRTGKNGKAFLIIMFRTMKVGAKHLQKHYSHLNEADWPVFKIKNDPRFVGIGKLLSRTGMDEIPQLINVVKGEMSLVGPRPLPIKEARRLTKTQKVRELVKPGITSSWVVEGSHSMKFSKWMQLDKEYVLKASFLKDFVILLKTSTILFKSIFEIIINIIRTRK